MCWRTGSVVYIWGSSLTVMGSWRNRDCQNRGSFKSRHYPSRGESGCGTLTMCHKLTHINTSWWQELALRATERNTIAETSPVSGDGAGRIKGKRNTLAIQGAGKQRAGRWRAGFCRFRRLQSSNRGQHLNLAYNLTQNKLDKFNSTALNHWLLTENEGCSLRFFSSTVADWKEAELCYCITNKFNQVLNKEPSKTQSTFSNWAFVLWWSTVRLIHTQSDLSLLFPIITDPEPLGPPKEKPWMWSFRSEGVRRIDQTHRHNRPPVQKGGRPPWPVGLCRNKLPSPRYALVSIHQTRTEWLCDAVLRQR